MPAVRHVAAGAALGALLLAGCTGSPTSGATDCVAPELTAESVLEVEATQGQVAGLVIGRHYPPTTGDELKIVWRVTGEGPLTVEVTRPDGSAGNLTFGPEPHFGSTFDRPGDEWGTGFTFDAAGCWTVDLRREGTTASVVLRVTA